MAVMRETDRGTATELEDTPVLAPAPAPQGETAWGVRIIAVATDQEVVRTAIRSLRQWTSDSGITFAHVADLPQAIRELSGSRWDAVLAFPGTDRPEESLAWWRDALRGAQGNPSLLAAVSQPSMGLVLRAERLGVLDLLTLPLRREDFLRAIERLRAPASESAMPLPEPHAEFAGPFTVVG